MFDLGAEKKMKYEQGNEGISFGQAPMSSPPDGELDTTEVLNIAKDDVLSWPQLVRRTSEHSYPLPVLSQMEHTVRPFVLKSLEVNNAIIDIFNDKLGLRKGKLMEMHLANELSGCEARILRNSATLSTMKLAIGSHTDFGSLSILHNRQGGLQVLPPGSETWQYVKPIPYHSICNVGDALSILSGGILRSNLHRVLPPPSSQANSERWSLVFFSRPSNTTILRALVDDSPVIAEALDKKDVDSKKMFDTGATAQEWCERRVRNRRFANNTQGLDNWKASRGTESVDLASFRSTTVKS
ncbi:hypothetical protein CPB84DRAFT_1785606 [Gymnopilus junonius]|uniref:Fe2OG dioxygenase domain-containing protein n=1 Tax=Gymnopilus junonius TaxID=109634 RepID=A0A9P5NIZ3_GYMJU|nr:hypothetical protein CPB84DRAFT_1785606 [Gymnopilus junonius]